MGLHCHESYHLPSALLLPLKFIRPFAADEEPLQIGCALPVFCFSLFLFFVFFLNHYFSILLSPLTH